MSAAMDDDEFLSDGESTNGESEDDLPNNSEEETFDPFNDDEDPNPEDDNIDTSEMLKTLKHVQKVVCGFAKFVEKKGKARGSGVQTRKSIRTVRGRGKGKLSGAAGTSERPGSRFNSKYFGEKIIAKLDERKKKIIRHHGFGILLEYDGCSAPRGFVQWIADQVDVSCSDIVVGGKVISLDPLSVHLFLGLPNDGEDIKENYTESTKSNFLSAIKEPSLPTIKTFGDKLVGGTLSDDDVLRYFMVVALSTFLCANSSIYPSPQYLGSLIDVSKVKEWNWSKFIYDWMFSSITNYRKKHRSTVGGCRYFLAGYYLDYINFGVRNQLPLDLPRIHCWKGSMIKTFASYDRVSGEIYGKRPVKSIDDTCYAEEYLPEEACAIFRRTLDRRCDFIRTNDMDNMCNIFENHHTRLGFRSPSTLVAKMFMYMHRTHVINRGGDASDEAEGSTARVPPPRHDDGDDGVVDGIRAEYEAPLPSPAHHNGDDDAVRAKYEAPLPSPGHFVVQDDVFDAGMAGDTSKTAVKEVDGAATAANNTIIEDVHPTVAAPTETNEEECSMTDKIESDGLYDGSGGENCRASQSTEIIPSKDSSAEGSAISKRKRKRCASQYSSANSVASRTRLSQRLGKSPLSHIKDHNAEATVPDQTGNGCNKDNTVVIEEDQVLTTNVATKRQKLHLKKGKATSAYTASPLVPTIHEGETTNAAAAMPLVGTVERAPGQTGEAPSLRNAIGSLSGLGPFGVENAQAGSRADLDENAVSAQDLNDPNLRRPVGTTCDTSCPLDRALSMLSRVSTSGQNVGANMSHGGVPGNVETKSNLNLKSRSASKEWVFVDKPTSPRGGNVSNEETIGTGNAGTKINGNVENDVIRMESLPLTEYSEIEEDPSQPVPLAAVSPYGDPIKITPIQSRLPSHREKSVVGVPCLSAKSIGSYGFVLNSESSSEVVWQSSSSKVAIHRPRRLAKPSMYKISPFIIPQSKISVSKLESDVYEAVLKMGESSEHLNLKVVDYGFVVVLLSALSSSLRPGGKVNHFVVNAFCKLLFLRKHPRDSRKHYFFSKVGDYLIGNHGRDDEKEKELFETALYFPILFHDRWYVVVLYFSLRWCIILDSCTVCFGVDSAFHKAVKDEFLENLATVWKQVINIDYGLHAFHVFFGTVPQQSDNIINDSGVYAIKNLEHFEVHLNMLEKYTEDDISQLRIKLVNDMVFNEYNSAYDGTCKVKEVSGNLNQGALFEACL